MEVSSFELVEILNKIVSNRKYIGHLDSVYVICIYCVYMFLLIRFS